MYSGEQELKVCNNPQYSIEDQIHCMSALGKNAYQRHYHDSDVKVAAANLFVASNKKTRLDSQEKRLFKPGYEAFAKIC